jgi:hypothetical protein
MVDPINNAELISLLSEADDLPLVEGSVLRLSAIQVRLGDAIPGMTCPHPITGPVSDRLNELDHLYVEAKESGNLLAPEVISRFQALTS